MKADDGDRMTITEAAAWLISQPGTVMTAPDGRGTLLVLGPGERAALGRLLALIDADTVPDGPDLRLFAMLTAAARGAGP